MAMRGFLLRFSGFRGSTLRQLNRDEQKRSVPDRFRIDECCDFCHANVLTNDARDPQSIRCNAVQKCRAGYKPQAIQKMGWAGLEPAANALKGRCSTIELPTPGILVLAVCYRNRNQPRKLSGLLYR